MLFVVLQAALDLQAFFDSFKVDVVAPAALVEEGEEVGREEGGEEQQVEEEGERVEEEHEVEEEEGEEEREDEVIEEKDVVAPFVETVMVEVAPLKTEGEVLGVEGGPAVEEEKEEGGGQEEEDDEGEEEEGEQQ